MKQLNKLLPRRHARLFSQTIRTIRGRGARLNVRLGGKMGPISGDPLDLECTVVRARKNVLQHFPGAAGSIGDPASLRVGGIDIIVASARNQVRSPDVFTELGKDPTSKEIIVVKSKNHFRAEYGKIAAGFLYLSADGGLSTRMLMPSSGYRRRR